MSELPESDYKAAVTTISHGVKVNICEIKRKGEVFRSKIEALKIKWWFWNWKKMHYAKLKIPYVCLTANRYNRRVTEVEDRSLEIIESEDKRRKRSRGKH